MKCEICKKEKAYSISTMNDVDWFVTGECTADTERYYVLLDNSPMDFNGWLRHLGEKRWFTYPSELSFTEAATRAKFAKAEAL